MTRQERIRRVAWLCIHFTRNLAFYRAIRDLELGKKEGDFWITMEGNCLDIAVLEWCKLFGEKTGEHSWHKMARDRDSFRASLLSDLSIKQSEWDAAWSKIREYRNKFVAHLDSEHMMHPPDMKLAQGMVKFYFEQMHADKDGANALAGFLTDLDAYYDLCYSDTLAATKT